MKNPVRKGIDQQNGVSVGRRTDLARSNSKRQNSMYLSMLNDERSSGLETKFKNKGKSFVTKQSDTIDARISQNLRNNLMHKGSLNTTLNNTYIGDQINEGSGSIHDGSSVLNNKDQTLERNPMNSTGNFAYSPQYSSFKNNNLE